MARLSSCRVAGGIRGRAGKRGPTATSRRARYLDDFVVGEVVTTPPYVFIETEITEFARQYDPQPFHVDRQAAARSIYAGLIASGYHTTAVCFRLFIALDLLKESSLGSPGVDDLRWLAPVRPGDSLYTRWEVREVRPSRSRPDRGILRAQYSGINQRDELVLTFIVNHLLARKHADS